MLSVFAGIFSAGFAKFIFLFMGHKMFLKDLGINSAELTKKELTEIAMNLPLANYVVEIIATALALLVGLVVGRMIIGKAKVPLVIITVIMLMMAVVGFLSRPYPGWYLIADLGFSGLLAYAFITTRKTA